MGPRLQAEPPLHAAVAAANPVTRRGWSLPEIVWASLVAAMTTWSLLAVGLAQMGLFQGWALLAAGLLAGAVGWGAWRALRSLGTRTPRRELLYLPALVLLGALLFGWPAEAFPQNGDASIYPNTAALLIRTGGLTYHYDPLDGLAPEQKELFYIPADRQLDNVEIQSYEGLLYGAYYVMDPADNRIVSSRPTLAIAWMGLLGMLGNDRAMLYVTPLFGVASLVSLFYLGKRVFGPRTGALAAVWLLASFPQLHFSRAPYGEVAGQFFVLTLLYALVAYWQTRRLALIALGIAALTAAFAARIDVLLALPTLLIFLLLLAWRREGKGLAVTLAGTGGLLAFTLWTVNRPYVGATAEILLAGYLSRLGQISPAAAAAVILAGLLGLLLLLFVIRRIPGTYLRHALRWLVTIVVFLGLGYALYVRPLTPELTTLADGTAIQTHSEEIMAVAARYVSPLFLWLGASGIVLAFWRKRLRVGQVLLFVCVLSFGSLVFWKYTTARVYPVALRRLVPEVLPGLALFGASAVVWLGRPGRARSVATALAGLTTVLLLTLSAPYWFHQGAEGSLAVVESMAERLPPDAVVLFEPQQEGATVGWFASPLWSLSRRNALQLNPGELDGELLGEALCSWQQRGREVYVLAQHDPSRWWPGEFQGQQEGEMRWRSSIIGQSLRFPPYVWQFDFAYSIYHWDGSACP